MYVKVKVNEKIYLGEWNEKIYGYKNKKSIYINDEVIYFKEGELDYEEIEEIEYHKYIFLEEMKNTNENIYTFFKSMNNQFYEFYKCLLGNFIYFAKYEEEYLNKIINQDWEGYQSDIRYALSTYGLYLIAEAFDKIQFESIDIDREDKNIIIQDAFHAVRVKIKNDFLVEELPFGIFSVKEEFLE